MAHYARHQAYLFKGILISVFDERTGERETFYFEGGIKSYVKRLNESKEVLADDIFMLINRLRKQSGDCSAI